MEINQFKRHKCVKSWLVIFFPRNKYTRSSITNQVYGVCLSVGFLVSGAGTWTTELLGFTTTRIGDQKAAIVVDEDILDLLL